MSKAHSYRISHETASDEIGPRFDFCVRLAKWLYPENPPLTFRLAPSISTRSEAELIGVSSPRFAVRGYLDGGNGGFLNIRRLEKLAKSAALARGHWPTVLWSRLFQRSKPKPMTAKELYEKLRKGACIADSLLLPPKRYRNDYFVTCELGLAYGEGKKIYGVPFMQHFGLGGGLCAQASCFMAVAALSDFAKALPTLAEITRLASNEDHSTDKPIVLEGLAQQSQMNALRSKAIGLWASRQVPRLDSRDWTAKAMRSYILSGFPLIVSVDLGRLFGVRPDGHHIGDSVMKKNGVFIKELPKGRQDHSVLIVGCKATKEDVFYFNDPATHPFIEITLDELYNTRRYNVERNGLVPYDFISVTPEPVRLSLIGERRGPSGLMEIAFKCQTKGHYDYNEFQQCRAGSYRPGLFRLVNFASSSIGDELEFLPEDSVEFVIKSMKDEDAKWIWIQEWDSPEAVGEDARSIWLWNAEVKSPAWDDNRGLLAQYLIKLIAHRGGEWRGVDFDDN